MCRFSRSYNGLSRASELTFAILLLLCLIAAPSLLGQSAPTVPKVARKVVQRFDPEYPTVVRNGHFEGQVILEAIVLPNGNVSKVDIKGGNPMLSQYAAAAVLRWKYASGPDKTVEEVTFHFNANDR
jgi:TonB family protein